MTEGCSSRTEPDVPMESFQSIPADAARRYLEQVNLSVHSPADAVQACEEMLDVLEQFLTDELGQGVLIHSDTPVRGDVSVDLMCHALTGRIMRGFAGNARPFVVRYVDAVGTARDGHALVRIDVRWE